MSFPLNILKRSLHSARVLLVALSVLLMATWWHGHYALDRMFVLTPSRGCFFFTSALGELRLEYRNTDIAYADKHFISIPWDGMNQEPERSIRTAFKRKATPWRWPNVWWYRYPPTSAFVCELTIPYWQLVSIILLWPVLHGVHHYYRARRDRRPGGAFPVIQ